MNILIPKTIHYIWLGGKPMHPLMVQWRQEWESLHPGWEVKIWSETPGRPASLTSWHETLDSSFPELLRDSCHLSQKSNIWRYELLHRLGGLYLDTDFEPLKCIEPLIVGLKAFAGKCHVANSPNMTIGCGGMFGCVSRDPWTKDLIENMPSRDPGISMSLGASYFNEITSRHPEVHLFEPDVFYSQRCEQPGHYKSPIPTAAYAVHRWSSKWFPDGFKPLTTEKPCPSHISSIPQQAQDRIDG
jgi:inositol phosphorylceramide mannosyltransferase catalytic subunit